MSHIEIKFKVMIFYGKIIAIDKSKKSFKIVSKGHRNQQGLYYLKKMT